MTFNEKNYYKNLIKEKVPQFINDSGKHFENSSLCEPEFQEELIKKLQDEIENIEETK